MTNGKWFQIWLRLILFHFIVWVHFSHKIFDFENHWNTSIFCDQENDVRIEHVLYKPIIKVIEIFWYFVTNKNDVKFEYVLWKNVWFCFIFIAWVHFSHKTEKFCFWKSLKCFDIFWLKKNDVRFDYVLSNCLIWFKLRCLSRI